MSDWMFRNRFKRILRNLHLCDNEYFDKQEKLTKLCPFISELIRRLLKFSFNGENKSIDEYMISYYGTHGSRQRINNKPVRVGYNIWVLTKAYDYVFQFEPYQGVTKDKQFASPTKCRLGENLVLWLMKCSPPTLSYHIFKDNYFTSFCLLTHFVVDKIRGTGVFNKKSLCKCTSIEDKKKEKYKKRKVWPFWTAVIKQKKNSANLTVVGWNDHRAVCITSSDSFETKRFVRR